MKTLLEIKNEKMKINSAYFSRKAVITTEKEKLNSNKIKRRLNKHSKLGNNMATYLRALLECEDINYNVKSLRGRYRRLLYEKKNEILESLEKITRELKGVCSGVAKDPEIDFYPYIHYYELPKTGFFVSFHSDQKFLNRTYKGRWDGIQNSGIAKLIAEIECFLKDVGEI